MNGIDLLQAAMHYHSLGYQVIPLCTPSTAREGCLQHGRDCRDPGKRPLVTWRSRSAVAHQEVREWWLRWPNANIGALVGNGLIVADIDPRNGGWDTVAEFGICLPETVISLTGGGGEHWHFRGSQGIASQTLGPGLEVLAEGKIAVLPPSLHPSGQRYQWKAGSDPVHLAPAPVPDWLLKLSARAAPKVHGLGACKGNREWESGPPASSRIREALTRMLLSLGGEFQRDGRILARCPFPDHEDGDPSFYYSPATGHPGRKAGQPCVGGSADKLQRALDQSSPWKKVEKQEWNSHDQKRNRVRCFWLRYQRNSEQLECPGLDGGGDSDHDKLWSLLAGAQRGYFRLHTVFHDGG